MELATLLVPLVAEVGADLEDHRTLGREVGQPALLRHFAVAEADGDCPTRTVDADVELNGRAAVAGARADVVGGERGVEVLRHVVVLHDRGDEVVREHVLVEIHGERTQVGRLLGLAVGVLVERPDSVPGALVVALGDVVLDLRHQALVQQGAALFLQLEAEVSEVELFPELYPDGVHDFFQHVRERRSAAVVRDEHVDQLTSERTVEDALHHLLEGHLLLDQEADGLFAVLHGVDTSERTGAVDQKRFEGIVHGILLPQTWWHFEGVVSAEPCPSICG